MKRACTEPKLLMLARVCEFGGTSTSLTGEPGEHGQMS